MLRLHDPHARRVDAPLLVDAELNDDFLFPDGSRRRVYLMVIAEYRGDKIVGERLYLDEKLAGLYTDALGPDFAELPGVTRL